MKAIMANPLFSVHRIELLGVLGVVGGVALAGQTKDATERRTVPAQELLRAATVYELSLNDLPSDMTVTIVKHGNNPPEVRVEQGRLRWTSPDGSLAAFPRPVREHVERMFGVAVTLRVTSPK
jgi:hypothetical protein